MHVNKIRMVRMCEARCNFISRVFDTIYCAYNYSGTNRAVRATLSNHHIRLNNFTGLYDRHDAL